ncbi:hypothetical protein AMTRI_Chr04g247020 [Amborella trichopoda]
MQSPSYDTDRSSSVATREEDGQLSQSNDGSITPSLGRISEPSRHWRDVFWLGIFVIHLAVLGFVLAVLGLNRFKKLDRFKIDRYTYKIIENEAGQTETYWPFYALAAGIGTSLGWAWLSLLGTRANQMMKISVHILTTYLAVISALCFWDKQIFWAIAFAIGAALQFMYVMSVLSISLFWTGAVLCNTVHVVVSGMVVLVLLNGGQGSSSMPPKPLLRTLQHALTTSLGSICYGSLFTAAIRTLRWEIRGFRSKIGNNECLLCCVDFLFNLVETLVRFFNKYAYVQIAVSGKSFNHSARDAWELFQSTGIEALIAYDCSGAVLLMGTILGGLITGTCAGIWTWFKKSDRVVMVGFTAMLMGMILVGLAMVVVESAVTSIYICYAEDPLLINRWDSEFFNQMSEALHERLRYRSARAQEVMQHNIIETQTSQETTTV